MVQSHENLFARKREITTEIRRIKKKPSYSQNALNSRCASRLYCDTGFQPALATCGLSIGAICPSPRSGTGQKPVSRISFLASGNLFRMRYREPPAKCIAPSHSFSHC
jgi:hypothetical protein